MITEPLQHRDASQPLALLGDHDQCLREAAERMGVATESVAVKGQAWLKMRCAERTYFCRDHCLYHADAGGGPGEPLNRTAHAAATDKHRTKAILRLAGIPCPTGEAFPSTALDAALRYAAGLPGEICVKPNRGSLGDLAFPALRTADEVVEACVSVASAYDEILVEESVPGEVWRFFFVHPAVVGAKQGRPASVLGDGVRTIAELIDAKHKERVRRRLPGYSNIPEGHARDFMLARQGLTYGSVIADGRRVALHPASNGAMGGDSLSRPTALHPGYAPMMKRAFAAIPGLLIAAIDSVLVDPALPPTSDNFWVLEINTMPGFLPFHYPWEGPSQDICGAIISLLLRLD